MADVIGIGVGLLSFFLAALGLHRDRKTRDRVDVIEEERDVRQLDAALDQLGFVATTGLPAGSFVPASSLQMFDAQWRKAAGSVRGNISRDNPSEGYAAAVAELETALAGVTAQLHDRPLDASAHAFVHELRLSIMIAYEAAEALRTTLATRRTP